MTIPQPYLTIVKSNYKVIEAHGITSDSLSRYFRGCFDDIARLVGLYKTWICVSCLTRNQLTYGWGDKPKACDKCGAPTYEVGTFQARASYVGAAFEYACLHLFETAYQLAMRPTSDQTRLYDLEYKPNVVIEAKGSPEYLINPDGTHSKLGRAGMMRTDTEKKAFSNAAEWSKRFPNGSGYFFIITNALPSKLLAYRNSHIRAIYDVTNARQVSDFAAELRTL